MVSPNKYQTPEYVPKPFSGLPPIPKKSTMESPDQRVVRITTDLLSSVGREAEEEGISSRDATARDRTITVDTLKTQLRQAFNPELTFYERIMCWFGYTKEAFARAMVRTWTKVRPGPVSADERQRLNVIARQLITISRELLTAERSVVDNPLSDRQTFIIKVQDALGLLDSELNVSPDVSIDIYKKVYDFARRLQLMAFENLLKTPDSAPKILAALKQDPGMAFTYLQYLVKSPNFNEITKVISLEEFENAIWIDGKANAEQFREFVLGGYMPRYQPDERTQEEWLLKLFIADPRSTVDVLRNASPDKLALIKRRLSQLPENFRADIKEAHNNPEALQAIRKKLAKWTVVLDLAQSVDRDFERFSKELRQVQVDSDLFEQRARTVLAASAAEDAASLAELELKEEVEEVEEVDEADLLRSLESREEILEPESKLYLDTARELDDFIHRVEVAIKYEDLNTLQALKKEFAVLSDKVSKFEKLSAHLDRAGKLIQSIPDVTKRAAISLCRQIHIRPEKTSEILGNNVSAREEIINIFRTEVEELIKNASDKDLHISQEQYQHYFAIARNGNLNELNEPLNRLNESLARIDQTLKAQQQEFVEFEQSAKIHEACLKYYNKMKDNPAEAFQLLIALRHSANFEVFTKFLDLAMFEDLVPIKSVRQSIDDDPRKTFETLQSFPNLKKAIVLEISQEARILNSKLQAAILSNDLNSLYALRVSFLNLMNITKAGQLEAPSKALEASYQQLIQAIPIVTHAVALSLRQQIEAHPEQTAKLIASNLYAKEELVRILNQEVEELATSIASSDFAQLTDLQPFQNRIEHFRAMKLPDLDGSLTRCTTALAQAQAKIEGKIALRSSEAEARRQAERETARALHAPSSAMRPGRSRTPSPTPTIFVAPAPEEAPPPPTPEPVSSPEISRRGSAILRKADVLLAQSTPAPHLLGDAIGKIDASLAELSNLPPSDQVAQLRALKEKYQQLQQNVNALASQTSQIRTLVTQITSTPAGFEVEEEIKLSESIIAPHPSDNSPLFILRNLIGMPASQTVLRTPLGLDLENLTKSLLRTVFKKDPQQFFELLNSNQRSPLLMHVLKDKEFMREIYQNRSENLQHFLTALEEMQKSPELFSEALEASQSSEEIAMLRRHLPQAEARLSRLPRAASTPDARWNDVFQSLQKLGMVLQIDRYLENQDPQVASEFREQYALEQIRNIYIKEGMKEDQTIEEFLKSRTRDQLGYLITVIPSLPEKLKQMAREEEDEYLGKEALAKFDLSKIRDPEALSALPQAARNLIEKEIRRLEQEEYIKGLKELGLPANQDPVSLLADLQIRSPDLFEDLEMRTDNEELEALIEKAKTYNLTKHKISRFSAIEFVSSNPDVATAVPRVSDLITLIRNLESLSQNIRTTANQIEGLTQMESVAAEVERKLMNAEQIARIPINAFVPLLKHLIAMQKTHPQPFQEALSSPETRALLGKYTYDLMQEVLKRDPLQFLEILKVMESSPELLKSALGAADPSAFAAAIRALPGELDQKILQFVIELEALQEQSPELFQEALQAANSSPALTTLLSTLPQESDKKRVRELQQATPPSSESNSEWNAAFQYLQQQGMVIDPDRYLEQLRQTDRVAHYRFQHSPEFALFLEQSALEQARNRLIQAGMRPEETIYQFFESLPPHQSQTLRHTLPASLNDQLTQQEKMGHFAQLQAARRTAAQRKALAKFGLGEGLGLGEKENIFSFLLRQTPEQLRKIQFSDYSLFKDLFEKFVQEKLQYLGMSPNEDPINFLARLQTDSPDRFEALREEQIPELEEFMRKAEWVNQTKHAISRFAAIEFLRERPEALEGAPKGISQGLTALVATTDALRQMSDSIRAMVSRKIELGRRLQELYPKQNFDIAVDSLIQQLQALRKEYGEKYYSEMLIGEYLSLLKEIATLSPERAADIAALTPQY